MKSFKQFKTQINEMFDRPARWQLVKDGDNSVVYTSSINDKTLIVGFILESDNDNNWDVVFNVDGEFNITNKGDEIIIFSTVLDTMKDFIQRREPKELYFTAEKSMERNGSSRIGLYTRLIRKFSRSHGYQLVSKDDLGLEVSYRLIKV